MIKFKSFHSKFIFVSFVFTIFIFTCARSYSQTMFNNISNSFLRLHIIANSDSTEDQMLKYEIRDSVIEYISPFFENVTSKKEALKILNEHLNEIRDISYDVVKSNGYSYPINVSVGNFYFPTKDYSTLTLPEGFYDALKIEIGDSNGQNWWCVMFPSLCIIDTTNCQFTKNSEEILKENLSDEEFSIITNNNNSANLKIKFKLIELFENL